MFLLKGKDIKVGINPIRREISKRYSLRLAAEGVGESLFEYRMETWG